VAAGEETKVMLCDRGDEPAHSGDDCQGNGEGDGEGDSPGLSPIVDQGVSEAGADERKYEGYGRGHKEGHESDEEEVALAFGEFHCLGLELIHHCAAARAV